MTIFDKNPKRRKTSADEPRRRKKGHIYPQVKYDTLIQLLIIAPKILFLPDYS